MQKQASDNSASKQEKPRTRLRFWWGGGLLLALAVGMVWGLSSRFRPFVQNPVWNGRRLSYWMRQDIASSRAALHELGSNAMPYLLRELQAKNGLFPRLGAAVGPELTDWDFARQRRYQAALALQYLDTNAVPMLLDTALAAPVCASEGELGLECAMALNRLETPASRRIKDTRLGMALRAPQAALRRNACRIFYFGTKPNEEQLAQIVRLLGDPEDSVRAAAARALGLWGGTNAPVVLSLVGALQDRHPGVRRLAAVAIGSHGSNAADYLPALRDAFVREPSMPQPTNDVDFLFHGSNVLSIQEQRIGFFYAMKQIDPTVRPPAKF